MPLEMRSASHSSFKNVSLYGHLRMCTQHYILINCEISELVAKRFFCVLRDDTINILMSKNQFGISSINNIYIAICALHVTVMDGQ
jgi:hypothetical protein